MPSPSDIKRGDKPLEFKGEIVARVAVEAERVPQSKNQLRNPPGSVMPTQRVKDKHAINATKRMP
tara:strand:- start:136 stop:330 length:195 start_codon:yes stop_codon:yes gene_type:complete